MKVEKGVYKHFKGSLYKVIGVALDTNNIEYVVYYNATGNDEKMFVRKVSDFFKVVNEGGQVTRFQLHYLDVKG